MNNDDKKLLDAIKGIRVKNNIPWLEIVEIALRHDRIPTIAALKQIVNNDKGVVALLEQLIHAKN